MATAKKSAKKKVAVPKDVTVDINTKTVTKGFTIKSPLNLKLTVEIDPDYGAVEDVTTGKVEENKGLYVCGSAGDYIPDVIQLTDEEFADLLSVVTTARAELAKVHQS